MALLLSLIANSAISQIAISNNGYEGVVDLSNQKNPYESWETNTSGGSTANFELEEANPAELTKAAKVVVTDWNGTRPGDRWNVQLKSTDIFNFTANTKYVLKFKAKASVENAQAEAIVTLGTKSNGNTHRVYQTKFLSTEWKEYQVYFEVDPTVVVTVEGKLGLSMQSDATFWFDAFSITEVDETYIVDGSIEEGGAHWSLDATDDIGVGTVEYLSPSQYGDVIDGQKAIKALITTAPDRVYDLKATVGLTEAAKNKNIRVSFWSKTDDVDGAKQKAYLPWHFTSTTHAPTFNINNEWNKYSFVIDYTDNGKKKGNELTFYFHQATSYYIDNVQVEEVVNGVNNSAPVVNVGSGITCAPGDVITLTGDASDPDGDLYALWWSIPATEEELNTTSAKRKNASLTVTIPNDITTETDLVFSLAANDNLLEGEASVTVKVKPVSTSIGNNKETGNYVFPNPATDHIQLASEVASVEFYNINGVSTKKLTNTSQRLDINDLPAGIYILKMTLKDNSVRTAKLIKR